MTAKEMFEKLGYRQDDGLSCIYYTKYITASYTTYIIFDREYQKLLVYNTYDGETIAKTISMQEINAINKQLEELGWLEKN